MPGNTIFECPTQNQLQNLLEDAQPTDETISGHVATCVDCQRELDRLTDSAELTFYRRHSDDQRDTTRYLGPPLKDGDLGSLNELAIERQIGSGGMGVVFQGRDNRLGREVAVKILSRRTGTETDARFVRESKAAAKLSHDHIVPVYSAGRTQDGTPYLVMQLIEGPPLKDRIARGTIPHREAAELIRQVALGLDAAHASDLVHRDVKPANILLDDRDNRAKLTDFGLARTVGDDALTQANVITGTPEYMSPEQISNPDTQDGRGDIYSLGITLYECLTGTTPFRGQAIQILEQHRHTEPIRPGNLIPSLPRDLETICLKSIVKDPARRYQTALEFAADLKRYLDGEPILARETIFFEKLRLWCRRNPRVSALAATSIGLLLLLAAGSTIAAWRLNAANKTILEANATADSEQKKATNAEKLAVNDRTAAIESLETLIDSLYDELSDNAATIKTREKVVTAAINGLKSITVIEGDRKADRTAFRAHLRMGDLYSLRGANQEAEQSYDRAIELGRQLLNHQPADALPKRELAMALSKLGLHYFRIGDPQANGLSSEVKVLLQEVIDQDPEDFDALVRMVVQHGYELAIIRRQAPMDPSSTIEYGESALPDVDRLFEMKAGNAMAHEASHTIHFCIGRAYLEASNPLVARDHFAKARVYLDASLDQTPEKIHLRSASAILVRAQAMVMGSLGELDDSIALFENALGIFHELSIANPDDKLQKQNAANTMTLKSVALVYAGRYQEALDLLNDAVLTYTNLQDLSPGDLSNQGLIINAKMQAAGCKISMNQWLDANQAYQEILEELAEMKSSPALVGLVQFRTPIVRANEEATAWLLGVAPEETTSTGKCIALALAARQDAQSSISESLSTETMSRTARIEPEFSGTTFQKLYRHIHDQTDIMPVFGSQRKIFEAATYGLIARNLANSNLPDAKERSESALQKSLTLIEEIAATSPISILCAPDLKWVRGTPEFNAIWEEVSGK